MALVRPDRHHRVRVAAGIPAAGDHHVVEIVDRQVGEQLLLAVERRPDAAFAIGAVAARAVGLVQVVAALDRDHLLRIGLGVEPGLGESEWGQLVEPVDRDEQHDHDDREEADPAGIRGGADDLGRALGGELDRPRRRWGGEALDGRRFDRWPGDGQTLLGLASGRVAHRAPRSGGRWSDIRCIRSASEAG